jgi:hypothetical protein
LQFITLEITYLIVHIPIWPRFHAAIGMVAARDNPSAFPAVKLIA